MAQPWGNNYAYQQLADYLVLVMFLAWAVSPYLYFLRRVNESKTSRCFRIVRFITAVLICGIGVTVIMDTSIHSDAQGALVFLFLPIYQWIGVSIFAMFGAFCWLRRNGI